MNQPQQGITLIQLMLVIAAGIFIGESLSDLRRYLWLQYEMQQVSSKLNQLSGEIQTQTRRTSEQMMLDDARRKREIAEAAQRQNAIDEQRRKRDELAREQRERDNAQRQAAIRQASETCQYWQQKNTENPRDQQALMMKHNACNRLNELQLSQ